MDAPSSLHKSCGLLLVPHPTEKRGGTSIVGKGSEYAQRVVAMNSDAGREAVEVHANALELEQEFFESSLVSHARHHSRHRTHALATTAHG